MLDAFVIFSTTGVVHYLYSPVSNLSPSALSLANELIESHLLESRGNVQSTSTSSPRTVTFGDHVLEYSVALSPTSSDSSSSSLISTELVVYLAIYPRLLQNKVPYVPSLISKCALSLPRSAAYVVGGPPFDSSRFDKLLSDAESLAASGVSSRPQADDQARQPVVASAASAAATPSPAKAAALAAGGLGKKTMAVANVNSKLSKKAAEALDYSDEKSGEADGDSAADKEAREQFLPSAGELNAWEEVDADLFDGGEEDEGGGASTASGGASASNQSQSSSSSSSSSYLSSFLGLLSPITGGKILTADDIKPPLDALSQMLLQKNVASDITAEITGSVSSALVGKKMDSFTLIRTVVRKSLEDSLERLLIPKGGTTDLLRSVASLRPKSGKGAASRPYVIVMCGINGVGKSTTLAKLTYYLKENGHSPMIAACDTFRSGAVEQLQVHGRCLGIPVFQQGYAKDPSTVAAAAIKAAKEDGRDVVLIDTAGRMQNNMPLMRALGKLVLDNKPDLIMFASEALVGNDGVSQLRMFDNAFREFGGGRRVDGIVLTKFDTVGGKVGAAITMAHVTGAEIMFVGTGQKYNHLRKLGVKGVVKALFS